MAMGLILYGSQIIDEDNKDNNERLGTFVLRLCTHMGKARATVNWNNS